MRLLIAASALSAALAAACGSARDALITTPTTTPVRHISLVADSSSAAVGSTRRVTATVTAADATPAAAAAVEWSVIAGGGQTSVGTTTTSSGGVATASWTLGTRPGRQSLVARVSGAAPETVSVAAHPDRAASFNIQPDTIRLTSPSQHRTLTFDVADRFGNRISNPGLDWRSYWLVPTPPTTDTTSVDVTVATHEPGRLWAFVGVDAGLGNRLWDSVLVILENPAVGARILANAQSDVTRGDSATVFTVLLLDSSGFIVSGDVKSVVTFSSSDPAVATVDASGIVRGISVGTATIRAVARTDSAEIRLTVFPRVELGAARQITRYAFLSHRIAAFTFSADATTHTFEPNYAGGGPGRVGSYLTATDRLGTLRWRLEYPNSEPPMVESNSGVVSVVNFAGSIDAINTDGSLRSRTALPACNGSTGIDWKLGMTAENRVFASLFRGCLLALADDGSIAWQIAVPVSRGIVAFRSSVYALDDTHLTLIDASGKTVWTRTMPFGSSQSIVDASGTVYVPNESDGRVIAIDALGNQRWSLASSGEGMTQLLMDASGTLFEIGSPSGVRAIEAATGQVRWSVSLTGAQFNGHAVAANDGRLYVGRNSYVYVLDAATGAFRGRTTQYPDGGDLASIPGTLFVMGHEIVTGIDVLFGPASAWSQWDGTARRARALP